MLPLQNVIIRTSTSPSAFSPIMRSPYEGNLRIELHGLAYSHERDIQTYQAAQRLLAELAVIRGHH